MAKRRAKQTTKVDSSIATSAVLWAEVVQTALRVAGAVIIAWLVRDAIGDLASNVTMADVAVRFLADIRGAQGLAWVFGGAGVTWGYAERHIRVKTVRRMSRHTGALEREYDPSRSSSEYRGG